MNMTQRFLLVATLVSLPTAAWAHHSYVAVDITRRLTVQGTVKTLEWTNPHVWVWIVGGDEKAYAFEGVAPSELTRFFGWTKRSLKAGERVTVEYAPFRNGDHGGALSRIIFPDGRVLLGRPAAK